MLHGSRAASDVFQVMSPLYTTGLGEFVQAYCQHGANRGQIIFLVVKVLSAQGDVTLLFLDKFFTILVRSELHLLACERLGVTHVPN
jgi:hypothetical protein